ncbi:hypothetical protein GCM10007161_13280 [Ignatzschineria indica]|nr:hypothetical protein GCM10007161_13280 [Ignatzschineria indica]
MTDLDKQLGNLTVKIYCKYCNKTYNVRLTCFSDTYRYKYYKVIENIIKQHLLQRKKKLNKGIPNIDYYT